MSQFLGGYPTYTQLPAIDSVHASVSDMAYTVDDGSFWNAVQPTAPPGATPQWNFVDNLRGSPGPEGPPGIGSPGPAGQIGPPGIMGGRGPQGPAGQNAFSYLSQLFTVPAINAAPILVSVTDASWMQPGLLVFIPGAGTFTVIGSPPNAHQVQLANSADPTNSPAGTLITAGATISPANMRGPVGPAGNAGPPGPPGPQGASGTSAYTTLAQPFTVPVTTGTAFVVAAGSFAIGQIVYLPTGNYFSIQAVNQTLNTLTLVNQGYPGEQPAGTVIPVGSTVSATGPQGPQGVGGPAGPQGIQGPIGLAPTGTISMYGAATPPGGWLICDGSAVSRTAFSALFSTISTTYGIGDGSSTFNLPNLQGRFALGAQATTYPLASVGGEATHTLVLAELAAHNHTIQPGGNHNHGASLADHQHGIPPGPSHSHADSGHTHGATTPSLVNLGYGGGTGIYQAASGSTGVGYANLSTAGNLCPAATYYTSQYGGIPGITVNYSGNITPTNTDNNGSGGAHNNMPPYTVVQYIIKA